MKANLLLVVFVVTCVLVYKSLRTDDKITQIQHDLSGAEEFIKVQADMNEEFYKRLDAAEEAIRHQRVMRMIYDQ